MTFSPAYQHQGYAREAMRAVMALLFEQLAHHRLIAVVDTRNPGAIKLLEGLGFRREAHYRQNIFLKASGAMSTCTRCCAANISEVTGEPSLLAMLCNTQFDCLKGNEHIGVKSTSFPSIRLIIDPEPQNAASSRIRQNDNFFFTPFFCSCKETLLSMTAYPCALIV